MYFAASDSDAYEMGYSVSRLQIDTELCDTVEATYDVDSSQRPHEPLHLIDHDISQLTKLRSGLNEGFRKVMPGKGEISVSPVKMLAGREVNYSRRFSSADRCHLLSRYLPVNGPWFVDQMRSHAYVSQFSADGSLFVAGFQGSHIRVYDVDGGWKIKKNILAKNLRWTVTDTSLSPDQRRLVYASMSPIVHIVNIGSAGIESLANVTDIHDSLDFSSEADRGYSFGIFSVKFSTDGLELVAGSSEKMLVGELNSTEIEVLRNVFLLSMDSVAIKHTLILTLPTIDYALDKSTSTRDQQMLLFIYTIW